VNDQENLQSNLSGKFLGAARGCYILRKKKPRAAP